MPEWLQYILFIAMLVVMGGGVLWFAWTTLFGKNPPKLHNADASSGIADSISRMD